jgi:hypothetical protein
VTIVTRSLQTLLQLLIVTGNLIIGGILTMELSLRDQLEIFGVARPVQTAMLLALTLLLILASLRTFGGPIRVAVTLVLVLTFIHVLLPVIQVPGILS